VTSGLGAWLYGHHVHWTGVHSDLAFIKLTQNYCSMHFSIKNIYIIFRSITLSLSQEQNSDAMTTHSTRSASSIWVVGATNETFQSSKLPSCGDVLKVLFYYHTDENISLKESIDKSVSLLLPTWEMARIPTKARNHVVEHVRKLHFE